MTLSRKRTAAAHALLEPGHVDRRAGRERLLHQRREIDRAEQAGAVRRQRLLAARIGRVDRLAIGEVVARVDAVDEDDAGLGVVVGRAHDALPQRARRHRAVDLAASADTARSHGASSRTAAMKASVTSTDRLKLRRRAGIGLGVDEEPRCRGGRSAGSPSWRRGARQPT